MITSTTTFSPAPATDKPSVLNDEIAKLTYPEKKRLLEVLAASYSRDTQPTIEFENCYPSHPWASRRFLTLLTLLDRCDLFERLSILGHWAINLSAIADAMANASEPTA